MYKCLGFASNYSRKEKKKNGWASGEKNIKTIFFNVGNCEDNGTSYSNNVFEKRHMDILRKSQCTAPYLI